MAMETSRSQWHDQVFSSLDVHTMALLCTSTWATFEKNTRGLPCTVVVVMGPITVTHRAATRSRKEHTQRMTASASMGSLILIKPN
jgi:hypothetical protein